MIYWGYVNKSQYKTQKKEKENEEDSDDNTIDEAVEDLGKVAIVGLVLFGLYELVKWGVATALAPETGGASWAAAGCLP